MRPERRRAPQLQRVVKVGARGVLTSARIEQTLRPAGLDWITALRAPAIKQLAAAGGPLQPSLFSGVQESVAGRSELFFVQV